VNLWDFEAIDWDDEENPDGNLAHCLRHGVDEIVVDGVLREAPVEIQFPVKTADFAIVGPDRGGKMWLLLLAVSSTRRLAPARDWQRSEARRG
jgi:hypothetical protein